MASLRTEIPDKEYSSSSEDSMSKHGYPSSKTDMSMKSSASASASTSASTSPEIIPEPTTGPSTLKGVDLTKYRRPELVSAIDNLTSWSHPIKLLTLPAMKIAWRSLMVPSTKYLSVSGILSQLSGSGSITHIEPPPSQLHVDTAATGQASIPPHQRPTLISRVLHFIFVGIPLALVIGIVYGIINVIQSYLHDIRNIVRICMEMFTDAKTDLQYFKAHPERRPSKDETTELFLGQVVHPYSNAMINKKLGWMFGFMRRPVKMVVNGLTGFLTRRAVNNLEYYGRHVQHFQPFMDKSKAQ